LRGRNVAYNASDLKPNGCDEWARSNIGGKFRGMPPPPPPPPPPPRVIKDSVDFNIFLSLVPILFVVVGFIAGLACGQ
jgi:hypothetical protein